MTAELKPTLTDAIIMIRNEIEYTRRGKHPGRCPMRDCVGQWQSLLRDLEEVSAQVQS